MVIGSEPWTFYPELLLLTPRNVSEGECHSFLLLVWSRQTYSHQTVRSSYTCLPEFCLRRYPLRVLGLFSCKEQALKVTAACLKN